MLERWLYRWSLPHFFKSKTNIAVHTSKKEKVKALSNYHMLFTTQILYSTFLKRFILKHWFYHILLLWIQKDENKQIKQLSYSLNFTLKLFFVSELLISILFHTISSSVASRILVVQHFFKKKTTKNYWHWFLIFFCSYLKLPYLSVFLINFIK